MNTGNKTLDFSTASPLTNAIYINASLGTENYTAVSGTLNITESETANLANGFEANFLDMDIDLNMVNEVDSTLTLKIESDFDQYYVVSN